MFAEKGYLRICIEIERNGYPIPYTEAIIIPLSHLANPDLIKSIKRNQTISFYPFIRNGKQFELKNKFLIPTNGNIYYISLHKDEWCSPSIVEDNKYVDFFETKEDAERYISNYVIERENGEKFFTPTRSLFWLARIINFTFENRDRTEKIFKVYKLGRLVYTFTHDPSQPRQFKIIKNRPKAKPQTVIKNSYDQWEFNRCCLP